jgi:hypothetical protein
MRNLLVGGALCLISLPAQAALIVTGTIHGLSGESVMVPLPMYTSPGRYKANIEFTAPGEITLSYRVIRTTSLFCDFGDGNGFVGCGGDDTPQGFDTDSGVGATTATLLYALAAPFREDYSPVEYGLVFDHADGASFEFTFANDGYVDYRAASIVVPEPATWAMMLVGFTAVGASLRRRRRAATLTTKARYRGQRLT